MCCNNQEKCCVNSNDLAFGASVRYNDPTKNPLLAVAGKSVTTSNRSNKFGGKFDKVLVGMYITKVIYSDPATIVFWSDGTKTMSKAQHGDTYSKETGLTLCVLKKLVGGQQVANLIKDWVRTENVVDLKLLRTSEKESKKVEPVVTEEVIEEVAAVQKSKSRKKTK